ncbi:MAG TPA: metal ABC transporter substrate-binding protein [Symbiobacteriaceae bacterium]|nr:metal ABC transporter substrate-binding protein [Symbiobacteriaceae bacterium]
MQKMMGGLLAALLLLGAGCSQSGGKAPAFAGDAGKVKVATSFYPMYEFARAVGGDRVDLINLVPAGTEPHDWEPTPGHIKALNGANLFIYNGAGFEHWVDKTVASLDNKSLVTVETAKGADLIKAEAGSDEEWDPHVWLDPLFASRQVEAIRDALVKADPAGKATYEGNAGVYLGKLKELHQEFQSGLSQCKQTQFFTSHSAFAYLAHRYNIEQHPIMGLSPDAEPKPKELAGIVSEAKEHKVKYIFFETLVSDKVAKLVAQEIGASTLVLNPIEGLTDAEVKAGKDYLAVMRENLANLKTALECGK